MMSRYVVQISFYPLFIPPKWFFSIIPLFEVRKKLRKRKALLTIVQIYANSMNRSSNCCSTYPSQQFAILQNVNIFFGVHSFASWKDFEWWRMVSWHGIVYKTLLEFVSCGLVNEEQRFHKITGSWLDVPIRQ